MPNPLTEEEQHSIEYHLGWVMDQQVLLMSGIVVDHQITSLLRSNVQKTPLAKVMRVREALCECDRVQNELKAVRGKFGLKRSGDVEFDAKEAVALLEDEYKRWTKILADLYGGHENLYSRYRDMLGANRPRLRESY